MLPVRPFLAAASGLALTAAIFFWRQNFGGQIGGEMSIAKILWLHYTILAWFVLPAFLCRSPLLPGPWRRVFAIHLINFSARAVIELFLLYVTVSWSPIYGIVHDLFSIALIAALARGAAVTSEHATLARRFSWTLRVTLLCEIVFAAMFFAAQAGQRDLYFASDDPRFRLINALTTIVDLAVYTDLFLLLRRALMREAQRV